MVARSVFIDHTPWRPVTKPAGYSTFPVFFISPPGFLTVCKKYLRLFSQARIHWEGLPRFGSPRTDKKWNGSGFPHRSLISKYWKFGKRLISKGDVFVQMSILIFLLGEAWLNWDNQKSQREITG
jgi:hypothetical protein